MSKKEEEKHFLKLFKRLFELQHNTIIHKYNIDREKPDCHFEFCDIQIGLELSIVTEKKSPYFEIEATQTNFIQHFKNFLIKENLTFECILTFDGNYKMKEDISNQAKNICNLLKKHSSLITESPYSFDSKKLSSVGIHNLTVIKSDKIDIRKQATSSTALLPFDIIKEYIETKNSKFEHYEKFQENWLLLALPYNHFTKELSFNKTFLEGIDIHSNFDKIILLDETYNTLRTLPINKQNK